MNEPLATIALPIRNMGSIGWLALESLCRQETAIEWELIIIQETDGHEWFDVTPYEERLRDAGCVHINRIDLKDRVNLAYKWKLAGEKAHPSSQVFIMQAGDCYSPPDRIQVAFDSITSGADWHDQIRGVFYHIKNGQTILYNGALNSSFVNLNMAFATRYAQTIPITQFKKGIDGFLFNHCQSIKWRYKRQDLIVNRRKQSIISGIDTHGMNTISVRRDKYFETIAPPFERCSLTLDEMDLPQDIIERLKSLRSE